MTVVGGVADEPSLEAGTLRRELLPSNESVGACEGGALLLVVDSYEGAREGRRYGSAAVIEGGRPAEFGGEATSSSVRSGRAHEASGSVI